MQDELLFSLLEAVIKRYQYGGGEDQRILLLTDLDDIVLDVFRQTAQIDPLVAFQVVPPVLVIEQPQLKSALLFYLFEQFEDLLHRVRVVYP